MKSGIYALASLDGSPLNREDLDLLGLASPHDSSEGQSLFYGRAVDELVGGNAVDQVEDGPEKLLFLGYLNEPEEALALAGGEASKGSARLTKHLLNHFGTETAWRLVGDYSFVGWNDRARELTLFTSQRIRDQLYWATNGKHIAVSPDILLLTKLPWVGRAVDTIGFALTVSDYRLRRFRTTETMWSGISRLPAGWSVQLKSSKSTFARLAAEPQVEDWNGTFDEAVEELTRIGRRIVGQQMARYGRTAFLLSGGLDSSITTVLGSMERQTEDAMFCLTSVAKQGSGVPDEWRFSRAVAGALQVPLFSVEADGENLLCPSSEYSNHYAMPILGFRHHLYEQFERSALSLGASLITDGFGGEFTMSAPRATATAGRMSMLAQKLRRTFVEGLRTRSMEDAFLLRLQPTLIAGLPEQWRSVRHSPFRTEFGIRTKGISPSVRKSAETETSGALQTRFFYPYLDYRLLSFAGRLPNHFFIDRYSDRKLARRIVAESISGEISGRTSGLSISPTYLLDFRQQAATKKPLISEFRNQGLEVWLDLTWLDKALCCVAAGANPYAQKLIQTQPTFLSAEFLVQTLGTKT